MLIDVRTLPEYEEKHLVGALHVELSPAMASKLPAEAKGQTLELYCRGGVRAGQAEEILKDAGYIVKNIGGLEDLIAQGYAVAS